MQVGTATQFVRCKDRPFDASDLCKILGVKTIFSPLQHSESTAQGAMHEIGTGFHLQRLPQGGDQG